MYQVMKSNFDAARPWAVVATFRSFNQVISRYEDEAQAKRRARDLNRHELDMLALNPIPRGCATSCCGD